MSDKELRSLEKLMANDRHDLNDEVKYLRARLRSGLLTQKRLDAAALFGSEAAILAGGDSGKDRKHLALRILPEVQSAKIILEWAKKYIEVYYPEDPPTARYPKVNTDILNLASSWIVKPNKNDALTIGVALHKMNPNNPVYYLARYCYGRGMSRVDAMDNCYSWMTNAFRWNLNYYSLVDYNPDEIVSKVILSSEW